MTGEQRVGPRALAMLERKHFLIVVGTARRTKKPAIAGVIRYPGDGGRTRARTWDPLIKSYCEFVSSKFLHVPLAS
jgi:hypothetical protein